jgi:hypothetical protein
LTEFFICDSCEDKTPIAEKSKEWKKHDICIWCVESNFEIYLPYTIEDEDK